MPGGRILVVDDDNRVRKALERILKREGYQVECSPNGRDALVRVLAETPDLILLDLMMPTMNGRQFLEALHDEVGFIHIPVVVMTAVRGIDAKQALSMGACDVIEKPFDIDELLNKIALAAFRADTSNPQLTPPPAAPEGDDIVPAPDIGDGVVVIVSSNQDRLTRLETLVARYNHRAVSLPRVTEELPRLSRVLEPRAILLDLNMPRIDGLTALHRLRCERSLDSVPILVISDGTRIPKHIRTEVAGLYATLLNEPFADDELIAFIEDPPPASRRDDVV